MNRVRVTRVHLLDGFLDGLHITLVFRHRRPGWVDAGREPGRREEIRAPVEEHPVGLEAAYDVLGRFCSVGPDDQRSTIGSKVSEPLLPVQSAITSRSMSQRGW